MGMRWAAALLAAAILGSGVTTFQPLRATAAGGRYFPETGHTLSGPLLSAWESGGGLWMFGYPISEPFTWPGADGETVIAQYFERARLEYHPEYAGTPYRVLGGLLGVDLAAGRSAEAPFLPVMGAFDANCDFFAATGHALCGTLRDRWQQQGGLPIFGYPISEAFDEGGHTVQYFERARLELHPEFAGAEWEVALGRLGADDAGRRGLLDTPAFTRVDAVQVTTRVPVALTGGPQRDEALGTVDAGAQVSLVSGPSWDQYLVRDAASGATGWVNSGDLAWSSNGVSGGATSEGAWTAARYPLGSYSAELQTTIDDVAQRVSVAVYDPQTNRLFAGGEAGPIAAASLSKVLLLAVALAQSEQAGYEIDADTRELLRVMIENSDNEAADAMLNLIGGQAGIDAFLRERQITGFSVPDPWDWGTIEADAPSWARFLALLGAGQLLNPSDTAFALGLMQNVIPEQRWGVLKPAGDRLGIGKNGWYLDVGDLFDWRVLSAGFVDSAEAPLGAAPQVVVVLTRYPGEDGMEWGVAVAERVTELVVATAEQRWAATFGRRGSGRP